MLHQEMQLQGQWLFRWRSYLPLLFFSLFIPAFGEFQYLFGSYTANMIGNVFCLFIGLLGLFVRCLVIGYVPVNTSGRNTKEQVADSLNTSGMYSMTRNPLYLGNFLMWSAPILLLYHEWLYLIYTLAFILYYERITMAEEKFLAEKFGAIYYDWSVKTPFLFPRFFRWYKPELAFSFKTVIRREYHGFYGLIAAMTTLGTIGESVIHRQFILDPFWIGLFIVGTVIYFIIRIFVKTTRLLKVEGRP